MAIDRCKAGIGLRAAHQAELLERRPGVGFLEVDAEHYFGAGGRQLDFLERLREHYPLSLHGSADPLDLAQLSGVRELAGRIEPGLVSVHLSSGPLAYTGEALARLRRRVTRAQELLGRRILVENPASTVRFIESAIPEAEFLRELARVTGCGILLDLNNLYVSAFSLGLDARRYLEMLPSRAVAEIHLANHSRRSSEPVSDAVWALYARALERFGPVPTLVEWDAPLERLLAGARSAQAMMHSQLPLLRAA